MNLDELDIIARRELNLSEFNTTQIVAQIDGLDSTYDAAERKITWRCYKGSDDSGNLVVTYEETLPNKVSTHAYVFSNLESDTTYYIIAIISNINGDSNKAVIYDGVQDTAISGGTIYPTKELSIIRFEVYQRSNTYMTARIAVSGLKTRGGAGAVHLRWERTDGNYSGSKSWYTEDVGATLEERVLFSVEDYGTYIFTLEAINIFDDGSDDEIEVRSLTVVVKGDSSFPECYLPCTYKEIQDFSYDNGRVTGTIKNYPIIKAVDWNQFCTDINTVRAKVYPDDEEWTFDVVQSGGEMKASLFQNLYDAIEDLCHSGIVMPEKNLVLESNKEADGEALCVLITELSATLQACRDYYWS